jgi:hypothetical protein
MSHCAIKSSRSALVIAALVLATTSWPGAAQTPPASCNPQPIAIPHGDANTFEVSFQGIVCFARWKEPYDHTDRPACNASGLRRRAIVVDGNTFSMRHNPRLFVPTTVDQGALFRATGQIVSCDPYNWCWVDLIGADMRIRGSCPDLNQNKCKEPMTVSPPVDSTFCDYVPQLRDGDFTGGELRESMRDLKALPSDGASGFFEIEGGRLYACAFANRGVFVDADHNQIGSCRPFAKEVSWQGSTTDGPAILEIRSNATAGKWVPVPGGNSGKLQLRIETVSTARRTPEHFALHGKLLISTILPTIDVCAIDPNLNTCTDAQIDVPGCSDTGWPE